MSERIEVGDLVMVVKPTPCCGNTKAIGAVFVVDFVGSKHTHTECAYCRLITKSTRYAYVTKSQCYDIPRLKKIVPPAQDESVETEREVTA